jgi:deoxyribose-phosphate aldolase
VARCAEILAGSAVAAGTTVGFPHGGQPSALKVAEARQALADGAQELDMVVNISKVLSGDWAHVREDIRGVLEAAHEAGARIKVTFENCYLEDYHKIALCEVCVELGADWVRTSTGYGRGGATQHDLELMRRHCPPPVQIKAAGGVRTLDALLGVRQLGVSRVGASRTASILDEYRRHANV